jgi:Outer membrane protein beta-barrel domain
VFGINKLLFLTKLILKQKKMKKLLLSAVALFAFGFANAQEQTAEGKWLIEANTGFGENVGATQIGYTNTSDQGSQYGFGLEGGYFVMDNLAVKVGLGYGGFSPKEGDSQSVLGYKIGAKYYVMNMIPVELAYNGTSSSPKAEGQKDPSYVSFGAGYAVFLGDNVSIEPGLRYNYSLLSKDDGGASNFQFNVGFALHF